MSDLENQRMLMPYKHVIHQQERYVEVCFLGEMRVESVLLYLQEVWLGKSEIAGFSELVDLREVTSVNMNTGQLAKIVDSGRALDDSSQRSKIALIVEDSFCFFKSELYKTLQQLYPASNKEVEIFKGKVQARQWLLES